MKRKALWPDDDSSWQARIAGWLECEEWSPRTAAFVLMGLDPIATHGPCDEHDFGAEWLTHHRPHGLSANKPSQDHLEMAFQRCVARANRADPAKVSRPAEWLRWSVNVGLEPSWLKHAVGDKRLVPLLPDLPPYKDEPHTAELHRVVARAGGKTRYENSPAARAKKILMPKIDEWIKSPDSTAIAFANKLDEMIQLEKPIGGKSAKAGLDTIIRWIRARRKALKGEGASAS